MSYMPCLTQELIASACVRLAGRLHTVKYFAEVPATLEHSLALCVEYDLLSTWQAGVMLDTVILCSKEHSETFYGAANGLLHVLRLTVSCILVPCKEYDCQSGAVACRRHLDAADDLW